MAGLLNVPSSADMVGVYDQDFFQQFPNARPMRATVRQNARAMEHPIETGQIITDYRVILPIEIEIPFLVSPEFYRDTYEQIQNLFFNSELLLVQTISALYSNMIISEMPHQESPDHFNSMHILLRFKQVQIVSSATSFAPLNATDTNTQNIGVQNPVVVNQANEEANRQAFLNGGG